MRLTTSTASYSRSEGTGLLTEGQSSCRSITDFRPSAVQSATIQPQSRVLKGKPPWPQQTNGINITRKSWTAFSKRVFSNETQTSVTCRLPCSSACSISGTREDSQVSLKTGKLCNILCPTLFCSVFTPHWSAVPAWCLLLNYVAKRLANLLFLSVFRSEVCTVSFIVQLYFLYPTTYLTWSVLLWHDFVRARVIQGLSEINEIISNVNSGPDVSQIATHGSTEISGLIKIKH